MSRQVDPELAKGIWLIVVLLKMLFVVIIAMLGAAVYERIKRKK